MTAPILIIMAWRIWMFVVCILMLNSISQLAFKPSWKRVGHTALSMLFTFVWPLAIFSPAGRKVLFNRVSKI